MKQRKPTRLKDYDYSKGGGYFVTICTKNRMDRFGEIVRGEMVLNSSGKIASSMIAGITKVFNNILIDRFIVMPNHVHCIINIIENLPVGNASERRIAQPLQSSLARLTPNETTSSEMRSAEDIPHDRTKMLLSKVVQVYKSGVTKRVKKIEKSMNSLWQSSFHDRIIRNEKEYGNIQLYIENNPLQWELDIENKKNERKAKITELREKYYDAVLNGQENK
ncbi:MAG: hypothetical protein IAE90_08625 [Ignavibacteria bacterium]|nr:hypothetical protein [Ignavibacteria bacterium]